MKVQFKSTHLKTTKKVKRISIWN